MSKNRHNNHNNTAATAAIPVTTEVAPDEAEEGVLIADTTTAAEDAMLDSDPAEAGNSFDREDVSSKEKQRVTLSMEIEEETPELVIELSKVYDFDGEDIESVDLSGLDNISQREQDKVMKLYKKLAKSTSSVPELTTEYGVAMTHVLTDIPLEIIKQFAFKDKIRIKNAIMGFLYGDD